MNVRRYFVAVGAIVAVSGISITAAADNICNEIVPDYHHVDGIPAYDQCPASVNSAIWTNNGVDTSSISLGPDWVRTQYSSGYQCTEYCRRYLLFAWGIDYSGPGNAWTWCDGIMPLGLEKTNNPVHGDCAVFAGGACGASAFYGHIVVVQSVDLAGQSFVLVEQNSAGTRSCPISTATCFLHVTANTSGEPFDAGVDPPADAGVFDGGAPDGAAGSAGFAGGGGIGGSAGLEGISGVGEPPIPMVQGGQGGIYDPGAGGSDLTPGPGGEEDDSFATDPATNCSCDLARPRGSRGSAFLFAAGLLVFAARRRRRTVRS